MDNETRKRIKEFVQPWSIREAKGLIICSVVMNLIFPMMIYSELLITGKSLSQSNWKYLLILMLGMIISGIVLYLKIKKVQILMDLYFAVNSLVLSLLFFCLFYTSINYICKQHNKVYLIFALFGYVFLLVSLFYHRYRVLMGKTKKIESFPLYGLIAAMFMLVCIVFTATTIETEKNSEQMIGATFGIFISYAMAAGIVRIMNFILMLKYSDEIDFNQ